MKAGKFFGQLLDVGEAAAWRERLRDESRSVVFTNGCFDLLHAGHVEYLSWARAQGDALIVGLNEDESVRRIKGESRPIVPFAQRAAVLLALRSVDVVVGFGERTPELLLDRIRPDVHVKSDQYREDELPGTNRRLATRRSNCAGSPRRPREYDRSYCAHPRCV